MTAKIKLNAASGGGSFSLQAPSSSANTRVMTLPDTADGTILTTTNPKAGNIIQVKQTVVKTASSQTSGGVTTFYDIAGMSISITPSSSSNKIYISFLANFGITNDNSNGMLRLLKDGSTMSDFTGTVGSTINGSNFTRYSSNAQIFPFSNQYLDTAGGTSAITYKLQWAVESGRTIYLNRGNGTSYGTFSQITAMEVAA